MTADYTITVGRSGVTLQWQGQTFEIEASDLEDGGWLLECDRPHCDNGDCPECTFHHLNADVAETLRRWHDEMHRDAFQFCDEVPCKTLARDLGVTHG